MFDDKSVLNRSLRDWSVRLLYVLVLLSSNAYPQQMPLKFSYLTSDNGLSHTDANDIKQDAKGFIWIATLSGLDRYDGYAIKRFYNTEDVKNSTFKNRIISICPDNDGNIWLGTEDGIQCFDSKTEKYTAFDTLTQAAKDNSYTNLSIFKNRLVAVCRGELKVFNIKGKKLEAVRVLEPKGLKITGMSANAENMLLSSNRGIWSLNAKFQFQQLKLTDEINKEAFSNIYRDKANHLLLIKDLTIYKVKLPSLKPSAIEPEGVVQFSIAPGSKLTDIIQDKQQNYWVSTDKGLICLNDQLQLQRLIYTKSFNNSINTNYLNKLFIDRSECLWICTSGGGINFTDLNAKLFHTLQRNPETQNTLSGNHIKSILEEDGKKVWIGTDAAGLNEYNLSTQKYTSYNNESSVVKLKSNTVTALELDNDNNLWIGGSMGIEVLNSKRNAILKLEGNEDFPTYGISALKKDYYGNMWFGNHVSLGCIWRDKKMKYHVKYYDMGYFIMSDKSRPELLVSTPQGLNRFIINNEGEIVKSYRYTAAGGSNSLSSNYPYPISQQNDSTYWIGTIGGGLNSLTLKKGNKYAIKVYGDKYNVFNDVESMELANSGVIWIGGNGLESFDPHHMKVTKYDKNDGLQSNSFKVGASFKGKNGRLYFGGINGLNYFYPDSIKNNKIPAKPVITDIEVSNNKLIVGHNNSAFPFLKQNISYSNELEINYLQNNFVIYFSSMHFANPLKCRYRYKLVGFDKEWKYADGSNPSAAYNNLDFSNYTFVVEATNNDGLWSTTSASLSISVIPPWWKSNIAKFFYLLLFILVLGGIYVYQARWYRLKGEIAIRDVEEKRREEIHLQREELYQQQLQFFTNISHEFRTPLTLILGPLEKLLMENQDGSLQHTYQLMYRNVKRLLNLINELMNFRKVADSVIKLQVQPVVFTPFINKVAEEFQQLANHKNITFSLARNETVLTNWFDLQIVEKVLLNLLSNAIKYTSTGGSVTLDVFFDWQKFKPAYENSYHLLHEDRADKYVYLRVSDTGIGISKESISSIFDRFYRVSNEHLGSGIGLALVKSLTLVHKGDIYVYSERHKGTEIIIALPWGDQNYLEIEKFENNGQAVTDQLEKIDEIGLAIHEESGKESVVEFPSEADKLHILLVEDNEELRAFLKSILQKRYQIYEAANGKEGLELAIKTIPDLIISDIMMPVMNGVELCKNIKETFETSHIPFLILSAKDALNAKIEGMQSGADYYFAKPLSIDLLLLTINNLFEQKQRLKQKYTKDYYTEATELVNSSRDKEFIEKLLKIIEGNIQNPSLDVDFLCRQLNVSRTKLYQKIKGVSDLSVSEFIRTVRLKKAVHIMTHQDVSMNEITDMIGFTSSAYFSTAFKKEFGKSPLQFLQSIKRTELNGD